MTFSADFCFTTLAKRRRFYGDDAKYDRGSSHRRAASGRGLGRATWNAIVATVGASDGASFVGG